VIVLRRKWSRGQVEARLANCLIGMEACVGAHHLSRKLQALGHDGQLMPAKYVCLYSKGQKTISAILRRCAMPDHEIAARAQRIKTLPDQASISSLRRETSRRRVAHQCLVASALLRVACLRIRGGRASGNPNFYPRPIRPGFS
jgi:transposase